MKKKHIAGLCAGTMMMASSNIVLVAHADSRVSLNDIQQLVCLIDSKPTPDKGIKIKVDGKVSWIDTPNTSESMRGKIQDCKAKITYNDGVTETVTIPVRVAKTYSEKWEGEKKALKIEDWQVKPLVKYVGENINMEDLESAFISLPANTKMEITSNVNTSSKGNKNLGVRLIFTDGGTQNIKIPVSVTTKEDLQKKAAENKAKRNVELEKEYYNTLSDNDKKVYEKIGEQNIAKEIVKVGEKIDLSNNIYNLPEGSKVKVISTPSNSKEGEFKGIVEVTLPDGDIVKVEIPVQVLPKNSDIDTSKNNNNTKIHSAVEGNKDLKKDRLNEKEAVKTELYNQKTGANQTPENNAFNQAPDKLLVKGEKGTPIKGEMVKTGEKAKKGIIAGGAIIAALAAFATYYLRKKKK